MANELQKTNRDSRLPEVADFEKALIGGDLSGLPPEQRVVMYRKVCESLGVNYLTSPFAYIKGRDGKLKLYALKDCTEQLRKINGVSITSLDVVSNSNGLYAVRATGVDKNGRSDSSLGAVAAGHLKGEDLANAMMKAETKAKRRLTLSICGLGILDESELDGMKGARIVSVEEAHSTVNITGELPEYPSAQQEPVPPPFEPRFYRIKGETERQTSYMRTVGVFLNDVKAWRIDRKLSDEAFARLEQHRVDWEELEAEQAQAIEPDEMPVEPKESPLEKAKKRAAEMTAGEKATGALAKLEQLKAEMGGK